jgi:hypothetical protein
VHGHVLGLPTPPCAAFVAPHAPETCFMSAMRRLRVPSYHQEWLLMCSCTTRYTFSIPLALTASPSPSCECECECETVAGLNHTQTSSREPCSTALQSRNTTRQDSCSITRQWQARARARATKWNLNPVSPLSTCRHALALPVKHIHNSLLSQTSTCSRQT